MEKNLFELTSEMGLQINNLAKSIKEDWKHLSDIDKLRIVQALKLTLEPEIKSIQEMLDFNPKNANNTEEKPEPKKTETSPAVNKVVEKPKKEKEEVKKKYYSYVSKEMYKKFLSCGISCNFKGVIFQYDESVPITWVSDMAYWKFTENEYYRVAETVLAFNNVFTVDDKHTIKFMDNNRFNYSFKNIKLIVGSHKGRLETDYRSLPKDTIIYVCEALVKANGNMTEAMKILGERKISVSKHSIQNIRNKKIYTDISDKYFVIDNPSKYISSKNFKIV